MNGKEKYVELEAAKTEIQKCFHAYKEKIKSSMDPVKEAEKFAIKAVERAYIDAFEIIETDLDIRQMTEEAEKIIYGEKDKNKVGEYLEKCGLDSWGRFNVYETVYSGKATIMTRKGKGGIMWIDSHDYNGKISRQEAEKLWESNNAVENAKEELTRI